MRPRQRSRYGGVGATALAVAALALVGCRERDLPGGPAPSTPGPAVSTTPTRMYASVPGSFVDLVAQARRSVVAIRAASPVKSGPAAMFPGAPETTADPSLGTGFLIEARGTFVVTTDKIASAANDLRVVLDDTTELPARLVGRDVDLDLALLAITQLPPTQPASADGSGATGGPPSPAVPARLPTLALGDSSDLKIGEWIVVLGNPFGEEVTAAAGIVSSTGREAAGSLMQDRGMSYRAFRTFLQTDARIHRGNSGGPVLDTAGLVIGVAVAPGDRAGELSFVLPINRVREVIDALRDHGQVTRGWLGVKVKPVTRALAAGLGLPTTSGAYVTEVVPASPALRAALRPGDVILSWNERAVDHASLPWLVAATTVGVPAKVTIWRNRAELAIAVVTEKMPQ